MPLDALSKLEDALGINLIYEQTTLSNRGC